MPPNPVQQDASAKEGRNQWTGPKRLQTPPEQRDPRLGTLNEPHIRNKHYNTPIKAQVLREVTSNNELPKENKRKLKEIFSTIGVSQSSGYEICQELEKENPKVRRHHNDPTTYERRGAPRLVSDEDLDSCEQLIRENGFDGRTLSWESLAEHLQIGGTGKRKGDLVSGKTIQRAMARRGWRHCKACTKHYLPEGTQKERIRRSLRGLALRPEKEDWRDVRFSDEVHFAYGPQGAIMILRKPGERYNEDCIQHNEQPPKKKRKAKGGKKPAEGDEVGEEPDIIPKLHAWAAIGYNFKSDLIWYDAGNSNGKMTHDCYINQILKPVVVPWIEAGERFFLEEDGDSGHGYGKLNNKVMKFKEENGIKAYKNSPGSPDLVPIENAWIKPKSKIRTQPHNDIETLRQLAEEGWAELSQESINRWVDSVPRRLEACIECGGKMTGF